MKLNRVKRSLPLVVVITPPLPWDGGTARTAIQVHAVKLIDIRLWGPLPEMHRNIKRLQTKPADLDQNLKKSTTLRRVFVAF